MSLNRATHNLSLCIVMTYVGDKDTRDKQGNEGEAALNNQRYVIIHSYGINYSDSSEGR